MPFVEGYYDNNTEYKPAELGYGLEQDFRGKFRAVESQIFLAYGLNDAFSVELEAALYASARLEKAPDDPSTMPARLEQSGVGDWQMELNWRVMKESAARPEVFALVEVDPPSNVNQPLIGTSNWETKLGLGAIRGLPWGTVSGRVGMIYSAEDGSFDTGEYAVEYLKRISPSWSVYGGIEGEQDEVGADRRGAVALLPARVPADEPGLRTLGQGDRLGTRRGRGVPLPEVSRRPCAAASRAVQTSRFDIRAPRPRTDQRTTLRRRPCASTQWIGIGLLTAALGTPAGARADHANDQAASASATPEHSMQNMGARAARSSSTTSAPGTGPSAPSRRTRRSTSTRVCGSSTASTCRAASALSGKRPRRIPNCAACWWGVAMSLGPHINIPALPDRTHGAYEAIQKARTLMAGARRNRARADRRRSPSATANRSRRIPRRRRRPRPSTPSRWGSWPSASRAIRTSSRSTPSR